MLSRYKMRDLISLDAETLYRKIAKEERIIVEFDDGEIETHTNITILSTYICFPLTKFPNVPILKEYHLRDNNPTGKNIDAFLNKVVWDIHAFENEKTNPEYLSKLCIVAVNWLFNDLTVYGASSFSSLSAFDLFEMVEYEITKEALEMVEPNEYSITKKVYPAIERVINDPNILPNNPIKKAAMAGTLKKGQLLQVLGPMGARTDINQVIFKYPIVNPLSEGIGDLYGSMIESRTGTIALLNNKDLLRKTEYFNRQTQLVAQYVMRLHHFDDCGTDVYLPYYVTEDNLETLIGKYYVDDNGEEKWVKSDDNHLINTHISIRSVLGCKHNDPQGVCGKCYGRLRFSIPFNTNIGNVSAVVIGDKITSSVLATKHHVASSSVEKFELGVRERVFMRYGEEPETLYLSKNAAMHDKIWMTVYSKEVENLANILLVPSLSEYPIQSVSQLSQVAFQITDKDGFTKGDIAQTSLYNRQASFSRELLEYLREHKWEIDKDDNVRIDLSNFPRDKPLLTLPFKNVNMYDVMVKIKSFLQSGSDGTGRKLAGYSRLKKGEQNYLRNYDNPVNALTVFSNMLNQKLYVNMVHVEVILYAMMVRSRGGDYRLPKPGVSGQFDKYNIIMFKRSLSAAMAFEKQDKILSSPDIVSLSPRPDHPYDFIYMGGDYST